MAGGRPGDGNSPERAGVTLSMMNLTRPSRVVAGVLLSAALLLSACGATQTATVGVPTVPEGTALIDVRMPSEFAEGHLVGAANIPVEMADFADRVAELDPTLEYLVYCRSGRRSAAAIQVMDAFGLRTTDLGSVAEASAATGIAVVR